MILGSLDARLQPPALTQQASAGLPSVRAEGVVGHAAAGVGVRTNLDDTVPRVSTPVYRTCVGHRNEPLSYVFDFARAP
jgi:hypothetical protein